MPDVRIWTAFGTGLATGVAGAFALNRLRKPDPGLIIQIGGEFFVQSSVIDAIAARAAKVVRKQNEIDMLLIRVHGRGVLTFKEADFWLAMPRYGKLYQATMLDTNQSLPEFGKSETRDVLIEFAAYGLARPGPWFLSRHDFTSNIAKGVVSFEIDREPPRVVERVIEVEVERQRPSGSYFKIGDSYFADERFLERLEWSTGTDFDESTGDIWVPVWRRGKLKFLELAQARALPEQQGKLYLLRSELVGVELEDLLTELVGLGLVGWGGEWATFPMQAGDHKPTGTPTWFPAGTIVTYEGDEFVDEATVKQMLTRLPYEQSPYRDGKLRFTWRTHTILCRPVESVESRAFVQMKGQVYRVGPADEPDVKAIMDEVILRRLARRPDSSTTSQPRPDIAQDTQSPVMLADSRGIAMAAGPAERAPALAPGEYQSWVTRYEWVLREEYGIDARRSRLLAKRLAAETLRIFESATEMPAHEAVAAAFAWLGREQLGQAVTAGLRRTAEDLLLGPAGPADCPAGARAFVVHQHDAPRMHFDLRIELGGVLKCWTLPRTPELRPGERRLAIHVEDHPRAWLGFSGTVPPGYGAGKVNVWDTGCWYADDDVSDGYQQGRFSLRLAGERLKGRYKLLRFRGRDEGDTWLLIREREDEDRVTTEAHTGDSENA